MNNIFDNIPSVTIDFSKPIDTETLLEKFEEIENDRYKKQQQREKDIKAWWKNLTLEQAESFLYDLETNPQKYRTMIVDDGFYKHYPPMSIILMKKALKDFIANKKR